MVQLSDMFANLSKLIVYMLRMYTNILVSFCIHNTKRSQYIGVLHMIVDLNTFSSFLTPQAFAVGIMWNASSVMALNKMA